MVKLSLARIMYGTNDDFHGPRPVKKSGLSVTLPIPANHWVAGEPLTLHELLNKAWQHLRRQG